MIFFFFLINRIGSRDFQFSEFNEKPQQRRNRQNNYDKKKLCKHAACRDTRLHACTQADVPTDAHTKITIWKWNLNSYNNSSLVCLHEEIQWKT